MKEGVEKLMYRVKLRMGGAMLMYTFETWYRNVREIRRQRDVMSRIRFRMKSRAAVGAFNNWCDFVDNRIYQRRLVKKTMSRLCNRKLSSAYQSWVEFTKTNDKLISFTIRMSHVRRKERLRCGCRPRCPRRK